MELVITLWRRKHARRKRNYCHLAERLDIVAYMVTPSKTTQHLRYRSVAVKEHGIRVKVFFGFPKDDG